MLVTQVRKLDQDLFIVGEEDQKEYMQSLRKITSELKSFQDFKSCRDAVNAKSVSRKLEDIKIGMMNGTFRVDRGQKWKTTFVRTCRRLFPIHERYYKELVGKEVEGMSEEDLLMMEEDVSVLERDWRENQYERKMELEAKNVALRNMELTVQMESMLCAGGACVCRFQRGELHEFGIPLNGFCPACKHGLNLHSGEFLK